VWLRFNAAAPVVTDSYDEYAWVDYKQTNDLDDDIGKGYYECADCLHRTEDIDDAVSRTTANA
jgi:hypothetical protein